MFGVNAFEWNADSDVAYSTATKRQVLIDGLVRYMVGDGVATQPSNAEIAAVLDQLMLDLTATCTPGACDGERTRSIGKGVCTAVLASAALTIH